MKKRPHVNKISYVQQSIGCLWCATWDDRFPSRTTAEDKAVALCWILHLIGDVHQPLHCATLYSPQFERGDLGGNSFGVKINGKEYRLHTFWDNALDVVPGTDDDP